MVIRVFKLLKVKRLFFILVLIRLFTIKKLTISNENCRVFYLKNCILKARKKHFRLNINK